MTRVLVIVGTRPEAIKMAPVIRAIANSPQFDLRVATTAQHREMLDQVLELFAITTDVDLNLMTTDQTLGDFAARSLASLSRLIAEINPEVLLIQGDTTTVMTAAIAACYQQVRIGHVEAGLRSFDSRNPFPEEINRCLVGRLADLHFAPTERARRHLLNEGVAPESIEVTGNTIVDALQSMPLDGRFSDAALTGIAAVPGRLVLVTAHRRENFGAPLRGVCDALRTLVARHRDIRVVYPVHLNPNVRDLVVQELGGSDRIHLVQPATYVDLLNLMRRCHLVLTDSGGIQEEAPSFHKPVLVLRDVTERPELLEANAGILVGTDPARIVREASRLLDDDVAYARMTSAPNPFGDGHAAERIVQRLARPIGVRGRARDDGEASRVPAAL